MPVDSPVQLGSIRLANRLLAAPMAGVSDRTFRRLAREAGAALAFPEMVSDKALLHANPKTLRLAAPYAGEAPVAIQLLGREPDLLADAAKLAVERFGVELVDLNLGCPVPKVVRNGEGAALLRDPALCGRLVERVTRAVPVTVSCKMRLGWDEPTAGEVIRVVAGAGVAFVTVHARLRSQGYGSPADWRALAELVAAAAVPVVGNGDVLEPGDASRLMAATGCAAVMIGRGSLGNPWIFSRALRLARTGDPGPPPSPEERVAMAIRHLRLAAADKGERLAVLEMRRHGSWYIKGLPGAAAVRGALMQAGTADAVAGVLAEYGPALAGSGKDGENGGARCRT